MSPSKNRGALGSSGTLTVALAGLAGGLTAGAILPRVGTALICASCVRSLTATLAISLPACVGVAGCPWVRESIGTSASS